MTLRLEQITPSTLPYPIREALDHRPADANEVWSPEFFRWDNVQAAHRQAMKDAAENAKAPAITKEGKGLVMLGGGIYLPSAYVSAKLMYKYGVEGELWHIGKDEMDDFHRGLFSRLGLKTRDVEEIPEWFDLRLTAEKTKGWLAKPFALRHTKYKHAAAFDADCYTIEQPLELFSSVDYLKIGAIFFPDVVSHDLSHEKWAVFGMEPQKCMCFESGQMWIDTKQHWRQIALTLWLNDHADFYYKFFWGDKETFCIAWRYLKTRYAMTSFRPCAVEGQVLVHYDFAGKPITVHRCRAKFTTVEGEPRQSLFWNTEQSGVHHRQLFPELPREIEAHRAFTQYCHEVCLTPVKAVPPDAGRLRDNLWISSKVLPADSKWLKALGFTAILNLAIDCDDPEAGVPRYKVGLLDGPGNSPELIQEAMTKLNELLDAGEKVLCHCIAGHSRSVYIPSRVLAQREGKTFDEVYREIKTFRGECATDRLKLLYGE